MDGAARLRQGLKPLFDRLRMRLRINLSRKLPFRDRRAFLRIEKVHLHADHVDARSVGCQIPDLIEKRIHIVFVDAEPRFRREIFIGPEERLQRVIGRHRSVSARVKRLFAERLASELIIVGRALVDDIPRIDALGVALGDITDTLFIDTLLTLEEGRYERCDFILA